VLFPSNDESNAVVWTSADGITTIRHHVSITDCSSLDYELAKWRNNSQSVVTMSSASASSKQSVWEVESRLPI